MITAADFLKWLVFFGYPPGGGGGGGGTVTPAQVQHSSFNFAPGLGADDAFTVALSPAVSGLSDGMSVVMSTAFTNLTDTPTLNVNGLGALPIVSGNGSPLIPGDIVAGMDYIFIYSAADNNFQLINPTVSSANAYLVQKNYFNYAPDIGAANAYVANLPVKPLVVLANGNPVTLEIANTNTGASTLTLNGVIAPIVNESGDALVAGQLTANGLFNFVYSGAYSAWVLMNPISSFPAISPSNNSVIAGNGSSFYDYIPTVQQEVHVAANGNDTTGNGSPLFPYASIGKALTSITDSASTKPYVVRIHPGTYSETGLHVPVWVFLVGDMQQPTKIIDSSGAISINSSAYNSGSQRLGFANLNLINSTGLTIDFQAIGGSGSNDIYINNCQIVGAVTFRGRGSDSITGNSNQIFGAYTSSGMQEVWYGGYFDNTVTCNTLGVTNVTAEPEFTSVDLFNNVTFTSSGSGNAMEPTLISSQVSGTLVVDQATTTLYADNVSLNSYGGTSQTNGGLITLLCDAKYDNYTPATPGNWSPVPTQVAGALDTLAARDANFQPLNANLTDISGLTPVNNSFIKGNGTHFVATTLVPANQVYVDFNNGNDTTGNGSQFAPWLTLQHAYNSITPAFANPYTIYISGHEDLSDVGTITAKANVNLVGIGNAPLITNAITIGTNLANDIVYFQNLILDGAVTWIRNDGFSPTFTLINVQCSQLVDYEQNGSGVADGLFYAFNCLFTGLTTQIGEVFLQSTSIYGAVDFKDAGSAAYFLAYSGDFFQSAITLNGGVYAEFAGIFSDSGYTLTGVTTGSGTPSINTDSNSIPPTLSGAYTLGLISQAKYINSNYTPVHYTATSSDVTGNLQGIDNALGTIASGSLIWTVKSSGATLIKGNGFFANSGSTITFTLPTTAAVGDTFAVSNMNSGNFVIAQNAGQSIRWGNITSTTGVSGNITSTSIGDGIVIVCTVANTGFQVVPGTQGELNIT